MRKRALAICLCIVLALVSVGATIAYFTDDDSAVNTFTVGKVEISLFEEKVEGNQVVDTAYEGEGFTYHLIPGSEYSKRPHVRVEATSEPCWLFVTVDNQIANIEGDLTIESQMASNFWEKLEGITVRDNSKELAVYAYKDIVEPAVVDGEKCATDVLVFNSFTVDGDKATNADIAECKNKAIVIKAYAIQAAGFESAADAWNAVGGKF